MKQRSIRLLSVLLSLLMSVGLFCPAAAHAATRQVFITFDANGGDEAPGTIHTYPGEAFTLPETTPERTAEVTFDANGGPNRTTLVFNDGFLGWNTEKDGSGTAVAPGEEFKTEKDTTLYAQWEGMRFGSRLPTQMSRDLYRFDGWYTLPEGGERVTGETGITGDITVYARWKPMEFTLTFDANGGKNAPGPIGRTTGELSKLPEALPQKSYTVTFDPCGGKTDTGTLGLDASFVCWNTEADGSGRSFLPGDDFNIDAETTLWAQWSDPAINSMPQASKNDSSFAGWYTAPDGGEPVTADTVITGDTVLFARWRNKSAFTVSFDACGGAGAPDTIVKTAGETVILPQTAPQKTFRLTFDACGGELIAQDTTYYILFLGWNTAKDGSGTEYMPGQEYSADENAVLYAQWDQVLLGDYGELEKAQSTNNEFLGWYTAPDGGERFTEDTVLTGDATAYAHWRTQHVYYVNFDACGGTDAPDPIVKTAGETVSLPETWPEKTVTVTYDACGGELIALSTTAYPLFLGWNTEPDGSGTEYMPNSQYSEDAGATLYAQWEKVTAEEYCIGEYPAMSADATFIGWYTEPEGGEPIGSLKEITEGMVAYAHWSTAPGFTLRFDANGGEDAPEPETKTAGTPLTLPNETPERTYTLSFDARGGELTETEVRIPAEFVSWDTEPDGTGVSFGPGSEYDIEGDMTLYARWAAHKIGETDDAQSAAKVFLGWYTEPEGGEPITADTVITGDLTAYAHWASQIEYTVNFDANGGGCSVPEPKKKTAGVPLVLDEGADFPWYTVTFDACGGIPVVEWAMYSNQFNVWDTKPDCTGAAYPLGEEYNIDEDVTVYAQWITPKLGIYGELQPATRGDDVFLGWFTEPEGGEPVDEDTPVTGDMTVYAQWLENADRTYTVSFDANGGVSAPEPMQKSEAVPLALQESAQGVRYTVSFDACDGQCPVISSYYDMKFIAWDTKPDGTGAAYPPGEEFNLDEDVTLYAQWAAPTMGEYGELPTAARGDDVFLGWFTEPEGGEPVDEDTPVKEDMTVYAQWQEKEKRTYTLTFDANGGEGAPEPMEKTEGTPLELPETAPERTYTLTFEACGGELIAISMRFNAQFVSWNTEQDGSGTAYQFRDDYDIDGDATLWAQWEGCEIGEMYDAQSETDVFLGWYTSPEGGERLTEDSVITEDITAYAHWSKSAQPGPRPLGDLDGDGKIKSGDARNALRFAARLDPLDEYTFRLADVNRDGKVNSADARRILRAAARLEPLPEEMIEAPAEPPTEETTEFVPHHTIPDDETTEEFIPHHTIPDDETTYPPARPTIPDEDFNV